MANRAAESRAPKRTDDEHLAWALRFAQADVSQWRDGDWLNAWEDARALADDLGPCPAVPKAKAQLGAIQKALRELVERVKKSRAGQAGPVVPVPIPMNGVVTLAKTGIIFVPLSTASREKRLVDPILFQVVLRLAGVRPDRLKHCPECGRLFEAGWGKRFDTAQCSLRDRKRRYRQKLRKGRAR